jgi:hypothetical protein
MSKRTSGRKASLATPPRRPAWARLLLGLSLLPMAAGAVLLGAALLNITLWHSPAAQAGLGGALLLAGFALANLIQQLWRLAGAFALGAAGLLLATLGTGLGAWSQPVGWGMVVGAGILVARELARRMPEPAPPRKGR